jgi:hypothetical protein
MSHKETELWMQVTIRKLKYVRDTHQAICVDLQTLKPIGKEEETIETHLSLSVL